MNLFVLVSTGQKVSNLPPVLEHAAPGDHVLWVESEEARKKKWTAAPRAVLEDRGLVTAGVVEVDGVNDPVTLAASLEPFAAEARGQYGAVFLVMNGGQKLTPLGLLFGFEPARPRLLYGEVTPAVHSAYPPGLDTSPVPGPYTRHDLDLADVLRVNGFTFATASCHARIWPDPLPATCVTERYGADVPHTYNLHAEHHAWCTRPAAGERVPFGTLAGLGGANYAGWCKTIKTVWDSRLLTPDRLRDVYSATLNLDERARQAVGAGPPPSAPLGDAIERAVARRVRAWAETARHPALRSVWMNVKVAAEATPHTDAAQFDVVLVLTNGILFNLECKAAEVDDLDLDAKLLRFRQTASQLARAVVVVPVLTAGSAEPWFETQHLALTKLKGRREALAFTLPGQPASYTPRGATNPVACPAFENELDKLLKAYRP